MSTKERIEKMLIKVKPILEAGKHKGHTCSECVYYDVDEKSCFEGGICNNIEDILPNTPACKLFEEDCEL